MRLPALFDASANRGYGEVPLGERDLELGSALNRVIMASGGDIAVDEHSNGPVLRLLAERLASIAVQHDCPSLLVTALRSLFFGSGGDARESAVVLPLLYRAAEHLVVDMADVASGAAEGFEEAVASELRWLTVRPTRSIQEMGYVERGSGSNFRFERTW